MATHSGSEGKVFVGMSQIAEVKSWSLEVTADTVDASTIGSSWRKNQSTIKSWAGSFEAFWDEEDKAQGSLGAGKTVTLNLYPQGDEEGSNYFTGNVIITSIAYKASFDGLVEASFSFTGTDSLNQSIVKPVEPIKARATPTTPITPESEDKK
jgi:predicted secreted protein